MTAPTLSGQAKHPTAPDAERAEAADAGDVVPDIVLRGHWSTARGVVESAGSSRPITSQLGVESNSQSVWFATVTWARSLRPSAVLALLILTATVLMILDLRGGPTDLLRSAGQAVGGPTQELADQIIGPLRRTPLRRVDESALMARITELEGRNGALEQQTGLLSDQLSKATQLQGLGTWAQSAEFEVIPGRVVAAGAGRAPGQLVTIDIGSSAGLAPDMAVVSQGALVGRVVEVGPATSSVQLVTDPVSRVGARILESREAVVAAGSGAAIEGLFLEPFAEVVVGQTLITMGSPQSKPYPAGLPIATITLVEGALGMPDRRIAAIPIADLSALETVGVIVDSTGSDRK